MPLPRPRPAEAPPRRRKPSQADAAGKDAAKDTAKDADKPAEQAAPAAPQPSACRLALTDAIAIAPSIPDIRGPGGCGGEDLVRLEAIVLPDKRQVSVKPAAILRCKMATAIADWIRTDIAPLAAEPRQPDQRSRQFRFVRMPRPQPRRRRACSPSTAAPMRSTCARFKLANGRSISLTDRTVPREMRESVLHSACARFSTVLGPGSDWYHEDHIHLDLMERRNNYRICQWNVWDPLPQVAPLLPAERPEEAPPREVAAKSDAESRLPRSRAPRNPSAGRSRSRREAERRQSQPTKKRR